MRRLALLCMFAAVCCIALAVGVFLRPAPAADPVSGSASAPVSGAASARSQRSVAWEKAA